MSKLGHTKITRVHASVERLRNFGGNTRAKNEWIRLWNEVGKRIVSLPEEQQMILLSDLHTAVESRLIVMERFANEKRNS